MARIYLAIHRGLNMIKTGIYITAFIVLCALANLIIDYTIEKEIDNRSPYYLSFASIGAISLESRLDCWAKINTSNTSQELEQNMLSLLQYLDMPARAGQLQLETNQSLTILRYEYSQKEEYYRFAIGSDQRNNESFYMLSFSSKNNSNNLEKYQKIIQKYRDDLKWICYHQYSGEIANQINASDSQKKILRVIMQNLGAKEHKIYRDGNSLAIIGFSPDMSNVVPAIAGYDQVYNVEAKIRNDAKAGKTRVYIGAPGIINNY